MSEPIERALEAFRHGLRVPFREDAALVGDLASEARPVIEALEFAIGSAGANAGALQYREGLAMAALLGRRAAIQRATPVVSLALVDALVDALGVLGRAPAPAVIEALRAVLVEGYCAAVEERVKDDVARRALASLAPMRVAPRCWAVIVAGEHGSESLRGALDRVGRTLLDADARACLVHVAITSPPSEDVAAEIFGFDATMRLIGTDAVFTGVSAEWRELARHPEHLTLAGSFEEGLRTALALAGSEVRETSPIVTRLKKLLGSSAR